MTNFFKVFLILLFFFRCFCGRLVKQHACFTASLAMKYSDVKLGDHFNQALEEWSVEKHTEQSPTDAYGVINFQGGSHSYRAKVCHIFDFFTSLCCYLNNIYLLSDSLYNAMSGNQSQ